MPTMPNQCPACHQALEVSRLSCPSCQMSLEGRFELPELLRLSPDDQAFVLAFVRAGGSLKDLGAQLKQSYPTVRNRLDEIIARLQAHPVDPDTERRRVLDAVARGELSVKEATRRLKEIR